MRLALAAAALAAIGCSSAPTAQVPSAAQERALARAATSLLEDAWITSARACLAVAVAQQSDPIRQRCEKVLTPARNSLLAADASVDAWTEIDKKNFPCLVSTVAAGLADVAQLPGIKLPQLVTDGLTLAQSYAGRCQP